MKREEFEGIVSGVLDDIPDDFAKKIEGVPVLVEARPSRDDMEAVGSGKDRLLLGLYQGVPLSKRGLSYSLVLPDRISIYQQPIETICGRTGISIPEMVRRVVLHEIAHHFGISDSRLRELGY